jgi:hypothetical protein
MSPGGTLSLASAPCAMVEAVMSSIVERVGWGLAIVVMGTGGCHLQIPEASAPDFVVLDQASTRVAADVQLQGYEEDEREVISLERHAERPEPPSRARPERSSRERPSRERTGEEWAQQRRIEIDEQIRQHFPDWQGSWCPLVLSFDGRPVRIEPAPNVPFETGGSVACASTDWPTATTPWLVRDLDSSGTIDGGHELFGTGTRMPDGTLAAGGFAALAVLDEDDDGRITPADPGWSSLELWRDRDRDRETDPGELLSLDDAGVRAIVLEHTSEPQCDARGNCMIERSSFEWVDHEGDHRTGAIIDIHLACRRAQP